MGNCISIIRKKREPNKAITVAIIGLDNAGKTTLCSVLTGEQPDPDIAPTVGFRNVKFSHSNFDVTLFDLGGGKNIRPIWKTYFGEVFGVMYMIDSSSPLRLAEARDMFRDTLEHPQVSGKPVLVLANKVDKEDHMKEVDVVNGLHLEDAVNANNCPSKLVMVSTLKGVGSKMDKEIDEGLRWLFEKIRSSLPSLEPRVEEDMRTAKEARDKEREERRARVKKQREEREKAEELERTRLGLTKAEDDEDDVVDGDPFKALDMEKLKKKEQRLKEEKKEKQRRMKELGYGESVRKSYDDSAISYGADGKLRTPRSSDSMDMKRFDISGDPSFRRSELETNPAAMSLFGRNTRASALPPLEPLGSLPQENSSGLAEKKKFKKKKKLTDYHLDSKADDGSGYNHKDDAIGRLGLSLHEPGGWNREADVHDLTPRVAKPKKTRMVMAGRIDEDEEENDPYRDIGGKRMNRYDDVDGMRHPQRQGKNRDMYPSKREDQDSRHMNGYDRFPEALQRESSAYRQSLRKISPPNMNRSDDEDDKDEGIEQDDSENSDVAAERYRAARHANNLNNSKMKDRYGDNKKRGNRNRLDSDEENDSYAVQNSLKDTLRFPPSPSDNEEPRDFDKEMDQLRRRSKNDYNSYHNKGYSGMENGDYKVHRNKNVKNYDDDDSDNRKSRTSHRNIYSPDEDEGSDHKGRVSDRSDVRRKKKRNLLRSNKLAPSDDEELDSHGRDKFHSPRLVQEHGSRNTSDADTPTRNRNSKVTQFHRNVSRDSDFGMKWGLAEDLPVIDDNSNVRRLPNFDDSDGGDIVF